MRLERFYKVPASTWFATVAGSAIHEITEEIDRAVLTGLDIETAAEFAPSFQAKFDELLEEERAWPRYWSEPEDGSEPQWLGLGEAPTKPREIKPSGKLAKTGITEYGGPNKKDYNWWLHFGPIYVRRYINWRKATGYEIAIMPDGRPGIELEFVMEMEGQKVRGFIDRVFYDPNTDTYIVVDLKTGKEPSGSLQLMTYFLAVLQVYGVRAQWALFWTPSPPPRPRSKEEEPVEIGSERDWGKSSDPVDTDGWNVERLEQMYPMVIRSLRQGVFMPTVTSMCVGCTVRDYCFAVKGEKANLVPTRDVVVERDTGEVVFDGASCKFDNGKDALAHSADDVKGEEVADGDRNK